MRFDDEQYLKAWQQTKSYPKIHDNIFSICFNYCLGERFCDLGCSTGLLTQRISETAGFCIGIEGSKTAIELGKSYGIQPYIYNLRIEKSTFEQVETILRENNITVIAARRIMPELFGHDLPLGIEFSRLCYEAGIKTIILQGRLDSKDAKNPLHNIDNEIKLFEFKYKLIHQIGQVAVLKSKKHATV